MTVTRSEVAAATPRLGRSLLVPGPQPPSSHLGATLLRHVLGTVIRYSCYQLGLPMPDGPPVRILRLRVFVDAAPLEAVLAGEPGGAEVLAALLHPGGAGELEPAAGRMRAAIALHRGRLALLGPRHGRGGARIDRAGGAAGAGGVGEAAAAAALGGGDPRAAHADGRSPGAGAAATAGAAAAGAPQGAASGRAALWNAVCTTLSGRMPYLCDAALGELVASLARRRRRLAGQRVAPALGQVAWQLHCARDGDLAAIGALDPFQPSWAELALSPQELADRCARARGGARVPARPGRRGGFREAYRWVLSEVRPLLLALGGEARADGIVEREDDVFFIPFDLGAELAAPARPSWLAAAVETNRREHAALEREPEHADEIDGPPALAPLLDRSAEWTISPLRLLE